MTGRRGRRYARLQAALPDRRGGRVVFLAHCLLNQNTRYLGGAVCPGAVTPAVEPYLADGTGIVQLPCPEQRTWGGVLKRRFLWLVEHPRAARLAAPFLPAVRRYLRWRYARLARAVAADVDDYAASGSTVVGLVGVAGSPSCGVTTTLDLRASLGELARCPRRAVSTAWMNDRVVGEAVCPGAGMFVQALTRELGRRDLAVPVTEYRLT